MKRNLNAAVFFVAGAWLALGAVGCHKKSSDTVPAGDGDMAGMDMSKPDEKAAEPAAAKTPAKGKGDMGDMIMPGDEKPAGHAAKKPAAEEATPGRAPVDLDQAQRQFINIRTQPITRGDAVVTIRTLGIVAYDETKLANVNARIMGWAENLYVDKPGQFVQAGSPLLDIYSPELYSAQYEYLLAYRQGKAADKGAVSTETRNEADDLQASSRKRLKLWEVPDDEIRALETSGKPTNTMQLRAPVSGYVVQKNISPGQMVQPGMTLYRVADLTTVWINADIYEYQLPLIKVGQKAAVTTISLPGRVFDARVDFIYAFSDNKTRTTTARLVMDNKEGIFKPDTYVNAEIKVDQGEHLLVPATAVFDTGKRQYVFVEAKKGHFLPRRVQLGSKVGDEFIVNEGLMEGEEVVVDGNFLLDSESQLRGASSGGGHQH